MKLDDITKRAIDEVGAQIKQENELLIEQTQEEQNLASASENVAEFAVGDSVIFTITSPAKTSANLAVSQSAKPNINFKMTPNLKEKIEQNSQRAADENLSDKDDKNSNERLFLQNLRERTLVLFEGLNETPEQNLQDRLDLTLKFLEFVLANVENRLENLSK